MLFIDDCIIKGFIIIPITSIKRINVTTLLSCAPKDFKLLHVFHCHIKLYNPIVIIISKRVIPPPMLDFFVRLRKF